MTTELLIPAMALVAAWALHLFGQNRQLKRDIAAATALIEEKSVFESLFDTAKRWHPMPCGRRLELEGTGFAIELNATPGERYPYSAYSPEGRCIAMGNDLSTMKLCAEKQADDRAEFVPTAKAWQPNDGRPAA